MVISEWPFPDGQNFASVAPGAIETGIMGKTVRDSNELNKARAAETALGRVGFPIDVGPGLAFLLMILPIGLTDRELRCREALTWKSGKIKTLPLIINIMTVKG